MLGKSGSKEYGKTPVGGGKSSQSVAYLAVLLKPVFCRPLHLILRVWFSTTKAAFSLARSIFTIQAVFKLSSEHPCVLHKW